MGVTTHLSIEMPDRRGAFELGDELHPLHPLAIGRRGVWRVEVDDEGDHLDEVVDAARRWLREHDLDELVLEVDAAPIHIHA
jgi:hypothetical protein